MLCFSSGEMLWLTVDALDFMQTKEEIDLDSTVHEAIQGVVMTQSFPKLVLDVHCTVLECDGSVASALIMGTSLALANSGIDMKDLVASCTVVCFCHAVFHFTS